MAVSVGFGVECLREIIDLWDEQSHPLVMAAFGALQANVSPDARFDVATDWIFAQPGQLPELPVNPVNPKLRLTQVHLTLPVPIKQETPRVGITFGPDGKVTGAWPTTPPPHELDTAIEAKAAEIRAFGEWLKAVQLMEYRPEL